MSDQDLVHILEPCQNCKGHGKISYVREYEENEPRGTFTTTASGHDESQLQKILKAKKKASKK